MKLRNTIIVLAIAVIFTRCNFGKPKVLIIGDSISIGYTQYVKEYFDGTAKIKHNRGNARHSGFGLENIDAWLGNEEWNIIVFNWGLWDFFQSFQYSQNENGGYELRRAVNCTIEEYKANLDSIVSKLKKTNAKLIFVATSYVPKNSAGRSAEDALKYNIVAKKVMHENSIPVMDIYKESQAIHQKYGKSIANVHYTEKGYEKLGELIIKAIEPEIRQINSQ